MCGKNNTTTQTTTPNPQALGAYENLITQAQATGATPYTRYGGEYVAPLSPEQQLGISGINAAAGMAQPGLAMSMDLLSRSAKPITGSQIQQYYSPYVSNVVNTTEQQFANQNEQQRQALIGNSITAGAFGGNREAIGEAELANQQGLAQAPVIAGLENTGYNQAVQYAMQQFQQNPQAAAYGIANTAAQQEQQALAGASAQVQAGGLSQQYQQALDLWKYQNQYANRYSYPWQVLQGMAGVEGGVGSLMGGTSSTTPPPPSWFSQASGAGTAALGAAGLMGFLWRGGRVGRASGGGVAGEGDAGVANRIPPIPESPRTLRLQQHQLVQGHRRAVLFPHGTPELPVPHGMGRINVHGEAWHYNPHRISGHEVQRMVEAGHEHHLLDLGPYSKEEVLHRINGGEIPMAVVERHPDGTEARAALGTHATAPHQFAAMHRTKSPGHHIRLEHPEHTIVARLHQHRAEGGVVPGFDAGGGEGSGGVMPSVPPSLVLNGSSKLGIPAFPLPHGPGAPPPPVAPPDTTMADLQNQAKMIGSLGSTIGQSSKGTPGQATFADNVQDTLQDLPDTLGIGEAYGGGIHYRRGGVVPHYDAGGGDPADVNDDPLFRLGYTDKSPGLVPSDSDMAFADVPTGVAPAKDRNPFVTPDDAAGANRNPFAPSPSSGVAAAEPVERSRPDREFAVSSSGLVDAKPVPTVAVPASSAPTGVLPEAPARWDVSGEPQSPAPAPPPTRFDRFMGSVAQSETGGERNPYGSVVSTGTGHRVFGKYQVYDENIPQWTHEALGHPLTPAQFLASPAAQEATVRYKLGEYVGKFGYPGAARAWLAGEGGMNNRTARDRFGSDPYGYSAKIMARMDGTTPEPADGGGGNGRVQVAGADDFVPSMRGVGAAHGAAHEAADPSASGVGAAAPGFLDKIKSNVDVSPGSKLWPALMTAGFGMMAGRSPFAMTNIGQGGLAGMTEYAQQRHEETQAKLSQQHLTLSQQHLDNESKRLDNEFKYHTKTLEHSDAALSETERYHKAEEDIRRKQQESLERYREQGHFQKSDFETDDGGHPVLYDTKTGQSIDGITNEPVTGGVHRSARATIGSNEHVANRIMEENKRERQTHPETPEITFTEALSLAHRAPNDDANNIKLMTRAQEAWKTHINANPRDKGEKSTLEYWEKRVGARVPSGTAPPAATPAPGTAPVPTAPTAAAKTRKLYQGKYYIAGPMGSDGKPTAVLDPNQNP